MPVNEISALERSQPGTGGVIAKLQRPEDDLAVKGGWRRDSPPAAFDPIEQTTDDRPFFEDPNS